LPFFKFLYVAVVVNMKIITFSSAMHEFIHTVSVEDALKSELASVKELPVLGSNLLQVTKLQ